MLPAPTHRAMVAAAGCAALLAIALLARSPTLATLAVGGAMALTVALTWTLPRAGQLRRERLEFAWWHGHGTGGAVTAGAPFSVRCYIRNRSDNAFELDALYPSVPAGTQCVEGEGSRVHIPPRSRVDFELTLTSVAAGRTVLQGLSVAVPGVMGLFESPLYFPNPLTVKVLPRASARPRAPGFITTGLPVERAGQTLLRQRGGGTELRELRELQPGDPFKAIAWKPSARRGKLLVREVEREVQETLYIVVDISGSMRGGQPGRRKLDQAIEIATMKARDALDRGDRVGIITVDGRIVSHVMPGEGIQQMLRVYDALLRATEIVDADLTAIDDDQIVQLVARYMRRQEGVELGRGGEVDEADVAFHAQRTLAREGLRDDVVASSPLQSTLRRYCRQRGLKLPYRAETRGFAKSAGLAEALMKAAGGTRMPRSIVVVSDLDSTDDVTSLERTLKLLRMHHHAVVFVWPEAEGRDEPQAGSPLRHQLQHVYGLQEARRLQAARTLLGRLGIPVVVVGSDEPTALVISRVGAMVRAA